MTSTRALVRRVGFLFVTPLALAAFAACSDSGPSTPTPPDYGPGVPITPSPSPEEAAERTRVAALISSVDALDAPGFAQRFPAIQATTLSYDPRTAAGLDLIRGSRLGLNAAEEEVLAKNGFVISDRTRFPTFTYGYASIYGEDLPLFVSADSILYAVHQSYDEILKRLEIASLRPTLKMLLEGMRSALAAGAIAPLGAQVAKDIDLYLAVPLGLLDGTAPAPVAGGAAAEISSLVSKANAASGEQEIVLFGVERKEDFSQFKPRGHYTDAPELESYFKAMMWLGRIDFRMIETQEDGSQVFRRRQFDGALGIASLLTPQLLPLWTRLDLTIEAFVGESDNMRPPEFPALLAALGAADLAAVVPIDDATIAAAIATGNFGAQRISSHIMINGLGEGTLPLSRTFLLLGQRYVVDSHVFSNVVYDRVQKGKVLRMMPDPLDAAFAVFGNNQAGKLLEPQLAQYTYAPDLAAMRLLVDDHGESFWIGNLYNAWLASLRALSPAGVPQSTPLEIAGTEAWGRRILNAQLASWAELRHDTILYAKQSYTGGVSCEFPDALVEPSPEFFGRLAIYAAKGKDVLAALGVNALDPGSPSDYFAHLEATAGILREMAEYQAQGTPFTAQHMAFINETVAIQNVCGGAFASGWYPRLFYGADPTEFDPTIADVHTQPTDEAGNTVGRVLHVGTGYPRLMVLTANTCTGPRAYAGLVSSYFEEITEKYERLDDPTWEKRLATGNPPDVPWLQDLVRR